MCSSIEVHERGSMHDHTVISQANYSSRIVCMRLHFSSKGIIVKHCLHYQNSYYKASLQPSFSYLGMVSKDFSKASPSTALRQCLISNMDSKQIQTEDIAYGLRFQPNIVPFYYNPDGEEIMSSLINRDARKENSHIGINYGNGHGLSLTLGLLRLSEFQNDRRANAVNTSYTSNFSMICESEINSRVCNTSNLSNQTLHGMASILTFLQNSPFMKLAQQLLDEVVSVSNSVESVTDKHVRRSFEITRAAESMNLHEDNQHSSDENHAVHIRII